MSAARVGLVASLLMVAAGAVALEGRPAEMARVQGPGNGYWGMALAMHPRASERWGLPYPPDPAELAALGASHILLPVTRVQDDVEASELRADPEGADEATLVRMIARARQLGMGSVVVPQVRLRRGAPDEWRGVLRPRDEGRWWRSYERFVLRQARLSERSGVEVLAIGSELTSLSGDVHAHRWRRLAGKVRRVYGGELAFVANHDALDLQAPFEGVDIAGVSAYFPLAVGPEAGEAEMGAAWRRAAVQLRELSHATGKPVVLFEVGYPSIDGGAVRPWDYTRGAVIDLEEQALAYRACVDTLLDADFIHGAFFWNWFGRGGPFDRHYTPRGKPALEQVRRLLAARAALQPLP